MTSLIRQTFDLQMHWPTLDPFLFCAHHNDSYPPARADMSPAASLDGRNLGADFESVDGWNMYHGQHIPGFPVHPHRGFETITYVRRGFIDHSDSLGAAARFGQGDVQWVTAGSGLQHSEMFPLLHQDQPNPLELFQIWLNLPADHKLVDGYFTMHWSQDLPVIHADGATITVVCGRFQQQQTPPPPPDSWSQNPQHDVAIWHITLAAGTAIELPAAPTGVNRTFYAFDGGDVHVGGTPIRKNTGMVLDPSQTVPLRTSTGSELMLLQGRPIGEPVAQQGPFVMNTQPELAQAFADYRSTQFGGWPWDRPDPVHPADAGRFARYPDNRAEYPS